jgi:hypothetical protein
VQLTVLGIHEDNKITTNPQPLHILYIIIIIIIIYKTTLTFEWFDIGIYSFEDRVALVRY